VVVLLEEVVCVVEGVRAATGMYTVSDAWAFNEYDVFFTDRRVIFAVVHGQRDWQAAPTNDREALATAAGKIFKYDDVKRERREQFKGKTPEEILHMHPDSFEIPYENIKSVKLSSGLFAKTLEIKALLAGVEKKFKFSIPKSHFEDIKNIVNKYLPCK
jgi:hypothetical protein